MTERWRLLKCERHGIQLGPKDTLRCGVAEDIGDSVHECERLLEIIEVEEVRWPYGEPPPEALEVLVEARARTIEKGLHHLNEASQAQLREWLRPSTQEELDALSTALRANWSARAREAKGSIATALGQLRAGDTARLEFNLQAALDRLHRIIEGEDYIERWEKLAAENPGAVSFTAPPTAALPSDAQTGKIKRG
jgi:hypothetical protein